MLHFPWVYHALATLPRLPKILKTKRYFIRGWHTCLAAKPDICRFLRVFIHSVWVVCVLWQKYESVDLQGAVPISIDGVPSITYTMCNMLAFLNPKKSRSWEKTLGPQFKQKELGTDSSLHMCPSSAGARKVLWISCTVFFSLSGKWECREHSVS